MKKKKSENVLKDIIKKARKESREEEIWRHGKPLRKHNVVQSKKIYKRNKRVRLDE